MITVVKTGMYWINKLDLTYNQLLDIQLAYAYPHPQDPLDIFQTYVETDDRVGVPNGDYEKLAGIIGCFQVDDRSVDPIFDNQNIDSSKLVLRDYQEDALDDIMTYFKFSGQTLNLAGNPGSGKTFMLAALLAKMKVKVLIIAHLTSLIEQITDEIETATGMKVTVLNAKNKQIGDINVATSQFISRNSDVWYQIKKGIGMLVIDEAESAGSESTLRIVQKCYAKYRIFISATYRRSVDRRTSALLDLAGHKKVVLEYKDLIKPTVLQIECPETFSPPINKMMYQREKSKFFRNTAIHDKVIDIVESSLSKNRQVLIAIDLIDIQNILADKIEALGHKAAIINSETKQADRSAILKQFDSGDIKVILGFATLNAGLSVPKISTIIKVSIPSNVEKLEQTIGRARRSFPGKEGAWVIDLHFSGFKDQSSFYKGKVKTEGWVYKNLNWYKFEDHLKKDK